jgi:baseplate J-like protein
MASIDDLITPLTVDEVRESIYVVLATLGVNTTVWKPGAVVRTIIAALAVLVSALSALMAQIARSGFLELAEGPWLELVAFYVYGVTKQKATFAAGPVLLSNAGAGVFTFDPGDLTFSAGGILFRNTATVNVAAFQTNISVGVAAVEAGAASTAFAGEIDEIVPPIANLSVVNAVAIIGLDEESDPALRAKCYDKLGSLSPFGPADAFSYAAKIAARADGTPIGVNRIRIVKDGIGGLDIYVATPTGGVTGNANDALTDLGAVNESIQRNAAGLNDTARVHSAIEKTLHVSYSIWLYNDSGLTQAQIEAAVQSELAAYVPVQPVGGNIVGVNSGKIFRRALEAVVGRAHVNDKHLNIADVSVFVPNVDFDLAINEVAVLGSVNSNDIVQIPPAGSAGIVV